MLLLKEKIKTQITWRKIFMWIKLNGKELDKMISPENRAQKLNNLKWLIEKYNFVEYHGYNSGYLIMDILTNGKFYNGIERKVKYGAEDARLTHPLIDHALFFRDKNGKVFLVSNPYLNNDEIEKTLSELKGDLNNEKYFTLFYDILGKNMSYHNIGETNLVVFYALLN